VFIQRDLKSYALFLMVGSLAIFISLSEYYVKWSTGCTREFVKYQQSITCIIELLFHQQKVPKNGECILQCYRLDPREPSNLRAWVCLRLLYIEDAKIISKLDYSLQQLNRAIMVCICVILWLLYHYFIEDELQKNGPNATTFVFISYTLNILIPVIYSLNLIVETENLEKNGCIQKL
jgi:hypothetical protein